MLKSAICTGQNIKSKKLKNVNLEIIFIDDLYGECICIVLNSHDARRYNVKFDDIEV